MVEKLMDLINKAGLCLQWAEIHPMQSERDRFQKDYQHFKRRIKLIKKLINSR